MPYYKDPQNRVHHLDDAAFEHLLTPDCVPITPAEATAIQVASIVPLTYQQRRVAEYPAMADYLDGIVKGDQAQVDAYIAACKAVKVKYPKP